MNDRYWTGLLVFAVITLIGGTATLAFLVLGSNTAVLFVAIGLPVGIGAGLALYVRQTDGLRSGIEAGFRDRRAVVLGERYLSTKHDLDRLSSTHPSWDRPEDPLDQVRTDLDALGIDIDPATNQVTLDAFSGASLDRIERAHDDVAGANREIVASFRSYAETELDRLSTIEDRVTGDDLQSTQQSLDSVTTLHSCLELSEAIVADRATLAASADGVDTSDSAGPPTTETLLDATTTERGSEETVSTDTPNAGATPSPSGEPSTTDRGTVDDVIEFDAFDGPIPAPGRGSVVATNDAGSAGRSEVDGPTGEEQGDGTPEDDETESESGADVDVFEWTDAEGKRPDKNDAIADTTGERGPPGSDEPGPQESVPTTDVRIESNGEGPGTSTRIEDPSALEPPSSPGEDHQNDGILQSTSGSDDQIPEDRTDESADPAVLDSESEDSGPPPGILYSDDDRTEGSEPDEQQADSANDYVLLRDDATDDESARDSSVDGGEGSDTDTSEDEEESPDSPSSEADAGSPKGGNCNGTDAPDDTVLDLNRPGPDAAEGGGGSARAADSPDDADGVDHLDRPGQGADPTAESASDPGAEDETDSNDEGADTEEDHDA